MSKPAFAFKDSFWRAYGIRTGSWIPWTVERQDFGWIGPFNGLAFGKLPGCRKPAAHFNRFSLRVDAVKFSKE
jgi:hypothetical protein